MVVEEEVVVLPWLVAEVNWVGRCGIAGAERGSPPPRGWGAGGEDGLVVGEGGLEWFSRSTAGGDGGGVKSVGSALSAISSAALSTQVALRVETGGLTGVQVAGLSERVPSLISTSTSPDSTMGTAWRLLRAAL